MFESLRMQPAFTIRVPVKASELTSRIREALKTPELRGVAVAASMCVDFAIEESERRFWSPHLSVQIGDTDDGAELHCRFAPRPEIWTMFMAIYFVMLILMFGACIYAYVQWWMGDRPWALVVIPVATLIIATLHVASKVGQSLSVDQMTLLRDRLDQTLTRATQSAVGLSEVAANRSVGSVGP